MNLDFAVKYNFNSIERRIHEHRKSAGSDGTAMIDEWFIQCRHDYSFNIEGVLLSAVPVLRCTLYPIGYFQCSHCHIHFEWSESNISYWNHETKSMICSHCHKTLSMNPLLPIGRPPMNGDFFLSSDDTIPGMWNRRKVRMEHQVSTTSINIDKMGASLADSIGGIYYHNWCIQDFRNYFLSRRVIRKWKKYVEQIRRRRVFRVLYELTNIGMDAAITLSKEIRV